MYSCIETKIELSLTCVRLLLLVKGFLKLLIGDGKKGLPNNMRFTEINSLQQILVSLLNPYYYYPILG